MNKCFFKACLCFYANISDFVNAKLLPNYIWKYSIIMPHPKTTIKIGDGCVDENAHCCYQYSCYQYRCYQYQILTYIPGLAKHHIDFYLSINQ